MYDIKEFEPLWNCWYVKELLGEGSYGSVFKIERKEFNNTYEAALKHIRVPQSQSEIKSIMADGMSKASVEKYYEAFVGDIVKEFVLMSKLKGNSHIVSYEDHMVIKSKNKLSWDIFIRMELLTSLIDYISSNEIKRRDVIKLGIDICKALELCQKFNIIHRDIKPENIFVSNSGEFKLGDFGIARQIEKTTAGLSKKGTFTYIAPEVYKGEAYGSTVDIYSLGIVMYRLLNNNRVPFMPPYPQPISHNDREIALIKRINGQPIEKPINADGRLAEIILKACAYDPKERYNSPLLMRMELEAILYSDTEGKIIYPEGDKAELSSVHYVSENGKTETLVDKSRYYVKVSKRKKNDEIVIHHKKSFNKWIIIIPAIILVFVGVMMALFVSYRKKEILRTQAAEAYEEIEKQNGYYPYCLIDIDNDGIDELIMGQDGYSGGIVEIYTYREGNAIKLGAVQTYGDAFENKYIFKVEEGIGLVMKKEGRTEYGYWTIDGDGLRYNLLAVLDNTAAVTAYSVEGKSATKEEYEAYIVKIASDKIEDYIPPRLTTTETTTETTTVTTTTTETTTKAATKNNSNSDGENTGSNGNTKNSGNTKTGGNSRGGSNTKVGGNSRGGSSTKIGGDIVAGSSTGGSNNTGGNSNNGGGDNASGGGGIDGGSTPTPDTGPIDSVPDETPAPPIVIGFD